MTELIGLHTSSIPYAVRFRQCLVEYFVTTNESKRPLYNAMKYATSFPVIFLSAAQRQVIKDPELIGLNESRAWYGEHSLFRLWCVAYSLVYLCTCLLCSIDT